MLLSVMCSTLSYAQNPGVILAPNYIPDIEFNPTPIPLPLAQDYFGQAIVVPNTNPDIGYAGQSAENASNIMLDASGDILFFIVDEYIYDKNGQFIGFLDGLNSLNKGKGASEILIIPSSTFCNRYYIVTSIVSSVGGFQKTPAYYELDMDIPNINDLNNPTCNAFGALIGSDGTPNSYFGPTQFTVPGGSFFPSSPSPDKQSGIFFGASDLKPDNSRLFLITNGYGLYTYSLDQNGFSFIEFNDFLGDGFNPYTVRSELEVALLDNGNYRVAAPFQANQIIGTDVFSQGLFTAEIQTNGTMIPSSINKFYFFSEVGNPSLDSRVRGVEFSNDGRLLYVTHTTNTLEQNAFEYFDFQNPTPDLIPIIPPNNVDFQYSMIERTFNNRLMIAHEDGIFMFDDASNPNSSISLLISMNYPPNYESSTPANTQIQKMFILQDQIDGLNYSKHFFKTDACCKKYNAYDIKQYSVNQSAIWEDNMTGSNPIITGNGNTIVIRNELRIPANVNLTIRNMVLQFAPGARLVIENGVNQNGGSLILDGTTLSVDGRCGTDEMWLGVEVWGNQNQVQNDSQGRLTMVNNSQIEHAWVGVLLSKREVTYDNSDQCQLSPIFLQNTFDNARNGGIVTTSNSTFYNNQRGVYFRPYFSPGGASNLSAFRKTNFFWDGILKENAPLLELARLEEVKGIHFKGCHFSNIQPSLYNYTLQGFGIVSRESQFHVSPQCDVLIPFGAVCPSQTVSLFDGLRVGVYATNGNGLSFSVKESDFNNNQYGILTVAVQNEIITENNFEVRESNFYQTAGLFMAYSSAYTVQENDFTYFDDASISTIDAESYGIVVHNSGIADNLIYKNTFSHLKIGGQTQAINSTEITPTNQPSQGTFEMVGLVWKCNDFQLDIDEHDLALMNGRMNYHQGSPSAGTTQLERKRGGANNLFSLTGESPALEHDIFLSSTSQVLSYAYLPLIPHTPNSYTPILVDINDVNYAPIITDDNGACPTKLGKKTTAVLLNKIEILEDLVDDKKYLLEEGAEEDLLEVIVEESPGKVKKELLEHSPYLSDDVLLAYIASNPPSGHLKQVMIANSQLSEQVKAALATMNLPNGTANQIAAVQIGTSPRTILVNEIHYLIGEKSLLFNELVSMLLLNEEEGADFDELIDVLKDNDEDLLSLKLLYRIYILLKDEQEAEDVLEDIIDLGATPEFVDLCLIQKELINKSSVCFALDADSLVKDRLETLRINLPDRQTGTDAECLLEIHNKPIIPIFYVESSAIQMGTSSTKEESSTNLSRGFEVSIYPNPSTGLVTFDFPDNEEGELKITVIDLTGKIMHTETWGETNGQQIDLSHLHKGMYLVKISIDNIVVETQSLKLQ